MKKEKFKWMAAGILITLLLISAPVFAEGEVPVDEVPPADEAPPTEEAPVEEAPPAEEVVAEAVETVAAVQPAPAPAPCSKETPKDDSAEVTAADPWWMVGTTKYAVVNTGGACPDGTIFGVTCWESATPITESLNKIVASGVLPSDRKLYVESDTYTETVEIDATTYPLLGQMNGLIGVYDSLLAEPKPEITGNVYVDTNTGGFTLSGFTINGTVGFWESAGTLFLEDLDVTSPTNTGIMAINHNGNVELREINSSNNAGDGAWIDNEVSTGTVKVYNSTFNNNGVLDQIQWWDTGLRIYTSKAVTIEGVTANYNIGDGISVQGFSALTIKHVIASHNEDIYGDVWAGYGISARSNLAASVNLENIQASYNAANGIYIYTLGAVRAKYIEANYNTTRYGAFYYDDISSTDIQKVNEFLSSDMDYDEWRFTGSTGQAVDIILETYQWSGGFDPMVKLYNSAHVEMLSDDDSYDGWNAQIQTTLPADGYYYIRVYREVGGDASSPYELSLNWDSNDAHTIWPLRSGMTFFGDEGLGTFRLDYGKFHQNTGDGLFVNNSNSIYVNSITATENGEAGMTLDNSNPEYDCSGGTCTLLGYFGRGSVTVTSPKTTGWMTANNFSGNHSEGIRVRAKGNVTVANFDAYDNSYTGLNIDNCLSDWDTGVCLGSGNVTVNVTIPSWMNWTGDNGSNGMHIESTGNVKIDMSSASGNDDDGIYVDTMGTIKLFNVSSYENNGYGAFLDALDGVRPRTVTVVDSSFDYNMNTGLKVLTAGAINVQGSGAFNNNSPSWGTLDSLPISLFDQLYSGDFLEGYSFYGFAGQSVDIILQSEDFDAYLDLFDGLGNPLVSDDNSYGGTDAHISYVLPSDDWYQIFVSYAGVDEYGAYVLSVNDEAHDYPIWPGSGMELDNTAGTKGVTVKTTRSNPYTYFDENSNMGIEINSNGAVSVTGASANNNFRSGISIETGKAVTVQDRNKEPDSSFNNNGWDGIYVRTLSNIKLYGVSASENGMSGADLNNCQAYEIEPEVWACTGSGSITIGNKKNYMAAFDANNYFGIRAVSNGTIKLTNISAQVNGLDGAKLWNQFYGTSAGVTVNTSGAVINDFSSNGWNQDYPEELYPGFNGLYATSNGTIKVSDVYAHNNENFGGGILLINANAPAPKSISLTNAAANGNDWHGIYIYSLANITLKNVAANNNADTGAILFNQFDGYAGNITIKYSRGQMNTFNDNDGKGLEIKTNGSVTIGNIEALNNFYTQGALFGPSLTLERSSVHEYFNNSVGPDKWWFYGENGTSYDIVATISGLGLDPFGIDPYIELYNDGDTLLDWDDNSGGGNSALISYTPTSDGWFYVLVSGGGTDGFYQLGINDPTFSDMEYIWNSGVSIEAGKNVTVAGNERNNFSENSLVGLGISTPGNITVKWSYVRSNGSEGMLLDNRSGLGNVSVIGKNASDLTNISGNGWDGLLIFTNGKTILSNLRIGGNGMDGIQVGEDANRTNNIVNLKNIISSGNAENGVVVHTNGQIIAKNIHALSNGQDGVYLSNIGSFAPINVTGESIFNNNGQRGLALFSSGNIAASKVTSEFNDSHGLYVGAYGSNTSLNNIIARYNNGAGISVSAHLGTVNIYNVIGMSNGFGSDNHGIIIIVSDPTIVVNIKYSVFMGNEGSGIETWGVNPTLFNMIATYYFGNDVDNDGDPNLDFN